MLSLVVTGWGYGLSKGYIDSYILFYLAMGRAMGERFIPALRDSTRRAKSVTERAKQVKRACFMMLRITIIPRYYVV